MKTPSRTSMALAVTAAAIALLAAACGGEDAIPPAPTQAPSTTASTGATPAPAAPGTSGSAMDTREFNFPTGEAILIGEGYQPPTDRVDRTGGYLPVNGMPTFVIVEAIWCPLCGLVRPILQELRPEYQDRVNFVILDYDISEDADLARKLGVWAHPGFGTVAPDSDDVLNRYFGPLPEPRLREILDGLAGGS